MKNLRNILATVTLMAILMIGTSTASAGILMTDELVKSEPAPCTETKINEKVNSGIVVHLTGIILGFTGIVVHVTDIEPTIECGIVVHN